MFLPGFRKGASKHVVSWRRHKREHELTSSQILTPSKRFSASSGRSSLRHTGRRKHLSGFRRRLGARCCVHGDARSLVLARRSRSTSDICSIHSLSSSLSHGETVTTRV